MQTLVGKQDEYSFSLDDETCKSDLEELIECLLNQIVNSRLHIPMIVNMHSSHLVDQLMNKLYNLAIEHNEYFPNQKFSSKKLAPHSCTKTNDQCKIGIDTNVLIEECLSRHLSKDEEDEFGLKSSVFDSTARTRSKLVETRIKIDVFILSKCCIQKFKNENNNSIILINNRSFLNKKDLTYETLERWDIKMRTEKYVNNSGPNATDSSKTLLNINNLFQAIRSYLHFSQLSSWINQTKSDSLEQLPKNIAYSISYSNEKELDSFDTDFQETNYDKQSFPVVSLQFLNNKILIQSLQSSKKFLNLSSTCLQFDLFSLKRNFIFSKSSNTTGIPHLTCLINHHLHLSTPMTAPIPIDRNETSAKELMSNDNTPDTSTNSIVITTPTTFPNIPIYFDANNNRLCNEPILQSTSPKVLISSFQLSTDETGDVKSSPILANSFVRCLQINSSPAPVRKLVSSFCFDNSLNDTKSIKKALVEIDDENFNIKEKKQKDRKSKNTNHVEYKNLKINKFRPNNLLGNFEECLLNGRLTPVGIVDGFYAELGASGSFFPEHKILPVDASFYQVSDDIAASPYLGVIDLTPIGDRGYRIPNKGTIQVTLFNPNKTVVKMFVVMYDLSDMPCNYRTFLRQRTVYVPCGNPDDSKLKSYLRYLIHLRFSTSKTGKMYLHSDIKLIFARNKSEIDPRMGGRYEYKTFTESPKNPKYSPKK